MRKFKTLKDFLLIHLFLIGIFLLSVIGGSFALFIKPFIVNHPYIIFFIIFEIGLFCYLKGIE